MGRKEDKRVRDKVQEDGREEEEERGKRIEQGASGELQ